jgi:hypothetical protein
MRSVEAGVLPEGAKEVRWGEESEAGVNVTRIPMGVKEQKNALNVA